MCLHHLLFDRLGHVAHVTDVYNMLRLITCDVALMHTTDVGIYCAKFVSTLEISSTMPDPAALCNARKYRSI